jgi:hypothetical protein
LARARDRRAESELLSGSRREEEVDEPSDHEEDGAPVRRELWDEEHEFGDLLDEEQSRLEDLASAELKKLRVFRKMCFVRAVRGPLQKMEDEKIELLQEWQELNVEELACTASAPLILSAGGAELKSFGEELDKVAELAWGDGIEDSCTYIRRKTKFRSHIYSHISTNLLHYGCTMAARIGNACVGGSSWEEGS